MIISFGENQVDWIDPLINFGAVLLGAVLAWATSHIFEHRKEKRDDLAVGYSLIFKVQELADEIVQLEKAVNDSFADAQNDGVDGPSWTKLNNIVGFNRDQIPVSSEELSLIARTKNQQLAMDVRELESGHRILKSVIEEIVSLRNKLEAFDLGKSVEGNVITFGITGDEYPKVAPLLIGLNGLSTHLDVLVPRISEHARATATRLGPFLKSTYKFKHFVSLSFGGPNDGNPKNPEQGES